jgi:hypothetical protein
MSHQRVRDKEINLIAKKEFQLVAIPWKGESIPWKLKILSATQIMACGNISLIQAGRYRHETIKPDDWVRRNEYADTLVTICKASMVSPSYDQLFDLIGKAPNAQSIKRDFLDIQKELKQMQRGPAKAELENELQAMRILWDFIIPEDTMAAVVEFELQPGNPIIQSITEETLLHLAYLAEQGNCKPSDYCDGELTAFHRVDIDTAAYAALREYRTKKAG